MFNPTAEVLGYLYEHAGLAPDELRQNVTAATLEHLEQPATRLDMHVLLCCARLLETSALPDGLRARLLPPLRAQADTLVPRDPKSWDGYGLRPADLAASPDSPFAAGLESEIDLHLDAPSRTCILIPSHELSRARGGPHCLTKPLIRDDLG